MPQTKAAHGGQEIERFTAGIVPGRFVQQTSVASSLPSRGTPAQLFGMVEAPNANAPIKKAITELKVPVQHRKRLIPVRHR
jgi:hypothetical protein